MVTGGRSAPGRYRLPIVLGSAAILLAGFLPWWQSGGQNLGGVLLPSASGLGLAGPGQVAFAAAVLTLAILNIGYLRGRWGFVLDAAGVYLVAGLVAGAAVAVRLWQLWTVDYLPLPNQSPGLVLAVIGVGLVLYGAGTGLSSRPSV